MPKKSGPKPRTRGPSGPASPAKRSTHSVRRPAPPAATGDPVLGYPPVVEEAPRRAPPVATATPARFAPTARVARSPRPGALSTITNYHYVLDDLRRIGILAAIAFLVLIGLTFVVH